MTFWLSFALDLGFRWDLFKITFRRIN